MRRRIKKKLGVIRADQHLWEVVRGASSALMIRILGAFLGFAVSVVIARMLGAEGSGIYYLALSVATIAATIGRVGLDNTVVRFIASHSSEREWGAVRFTYRVAMKVVAAASLLISVILFFGAEWIANALFDKPYMETPFRLASLSVLPLSISMILAESLRGLKNIPASQWITTVSTSLGTMLLLYPLVHLWGTNGAVTAYVVAVGVTAVTAWLFWFSTWRSRVSGAVVSLNSAPMRSLFQSSWPLYGIAITGLVLQQAATVFLGIWGTAEDIGVFNVANRVSSLMLFPLMAMISILAPKFAAMHRQGDMDGLKRLTRSSSQVLTIIAVPAGILAAVFADQILAIFGQAFSSGGNILVILLFGVVTNAITGPVGNLLIMAGHEITVRNTTIVSAFIMLAMLLLLVPSYGAKGAAISLSSGVVIQNLLMTWMAKKMLGFCPVRLA